MRLYGMYYTCKKYVGYVKEMKVDDRTASGNVIWSIKAWREKSIALN